MVQLLTSRLTDEAETFSADDWRTGSEALEQVLGIANTAGAIDRNESVIRRLNLSAALLQRVSLQRVSARRDIPILSPDRMCDLFMDSIPVSAAQAHDLAPNWRNLDVLVIRQLRLAKNLVTPMLLVSRLVADGGVLAELNAWEEVLQLLP